MDCAHLLQNISRKQRHIRRRLLAEALRSDLCLDRGPSIRRLVLGALPALTDKVNFFIRALAFRCLFFPDRFGFL